MEYRSLRFEHELLDIYNFQGNAVINYNDSEHPFTRIIEHKHFEFGKQKTTVITKEFSENWNIDKEANYPVNNTENQRKFEHYKGLTKNLRNVIFGGRLAEYRYYDMHQIVASSLQAVKRIILSENSYQQRVIGFLAERLFTLYILNEFRIKELPILFVEK